MKTIDYVPARGKLTDWGDNRANRSDRFLACVAYLDAFSSSSSTISGTLRTANLNTL